MPPENPNEVWVAIYNPDLDMDRAVVVTRAAFDEPSVPPSGQDKHGYTSWSDRGWQLTGAENGDMDRVDTALPKRAAAKSSASKES